MSLNGMTQHQGSINILICLDSQFKNVGVSEKFKRVPTEVLENWAEKMENWVEKMNRKNVAGWKTFPGT